MEDEGSREGGRPSERRFLARLAPSSRARGSYRGANEPFRAMRETRRGYEGVDSLRTCDGKHFERRRDDCATLKGKEGAGEEAGEKEER